MRARHKCAPFRPLAVAVIVALSIGNVLTTSALARAAGGDENLAAGLKKFDDGRRAFDAGQFEDALNDFNASLQLLASPNTRLYVGRCYRALGKVASAYTELKLAAREAQDRLVVSGEKRYAAARDAANDEAAELEAKVPRLAVAVPSDTPTGFVVKVAGKELPPAAWGVASETDPGKVVVEATGPRLVPFAKTVTLAEGAQERVDVPLTRVPTATLAVKLRNLPAGVALALDGQPLSGLGIDVGRELDVGPHVLVASAPGYVPFRWNKVLADKEKTTVEVLLAPEPRARGVSSGTPKWLFFTLAGGAVAALGSATGVALHANAQNSQQLALSPYSRDPDVKSSIQSQATVSNILFVAGGVLGIGATALAFTTHWKPEGAEESSVSVAPWLTPAGGGVGARGSF